MSHERLQFYIDEMMQASVEIAEFVAGMDRDRFKHDVLKQRAIGMNLLIIGEAAVRLCDEHPDFVDGHADMPWAAMRGMRNRIAHGYLRINLDTIWDTAQQSVPDLLEKLHAIRHWRAQGE